MKLKLERFWTGEYDTRGRLLVDDKFVCFTLEDEIRKNKVRGETAIPEGEYEITLRKEGGFHARYSKRFGEMHKGMLWLRNVPNFEYILIHCGNTDHDTMGCLLVGELFREGGERSFLANSERAYKKLYPMVAKALLRGDSVHINVLNKFGDA